MVARRCVTGVVPKSFRGTFPAIELDGYVDIEDLGAVDPGVNAWLYTTGKPGPSRCSDA
jgi:hypothetical protein